MEEIELGDAFLVNTQPKRHLYIVIAVISENNYLLVSITTSKTQIDPDKDCVINPGEQIPSFVVRQSTVAYDYALNLRSNEINKILKEGACQHCGKFPLEEVYKIQRIGVSSKSLAKKYKNILQKALDDYELNNYLRERLRKKHG